MRASDFIAAATAKLEILIDPPMGGPHGFTDYIRHDVDQFLGAFDKAAFNAGFNAAVEAILGEKGMRNVHFDHPDFLRDRSAAYRKAREGSGV